MNKQKKSSTIGWSLSNLAKSLEDMQVNVNRINENRQSEYYKLSEQIKFLLEANHGLQNETLKLSQLLKSPQMRGQWGEMQLKNIIETTGMTNYTSFSEQLSIKSKDGILRPDLVIRIPGEKQIIIDSKVPLNAYLEAYESKDDKIYKMKMNDHLKALKLHIQSLGQKKYWEKVTNSPAFVILFLPAESFLQTAMQYDADLLNYADKYNVTVMTPTLLLVMLRIIAKGWQEEKIYKNNHEITKLGGELYSSINDFLVHFKRMGSSLDSMINNYNKSIQIFEKKIGKLSNRMHSLGISKNDKKLPEMEEVDYKVKKS